MEITVGKNEVELIKNHLVGQVHVVGLEDLYSKAVNELQIQIPDGEQKLWRFMLKHPFFISLTDSGLALTNPHSAIRHRIFVMLALLETSPECKDHFLPEGYSTSSWVSTFIAGIRAAFSGVFGWMWIKTMVK